MNQIIEQFRKELLDLAVYKDKTVSNYIALLYIYFQYAKCTFKIDPLQSQTRHLREWMEKNKSNTVPVV